MVKPVKIHDNNLWDKFVSDSEQYFAVKEQKELLIPNSM